MTYRPIKKVAAGLPVGSVLMYDAVDWVDNTTLKGFYAMIGGIVPDDGRPGGGNSIPNTVEKFIMPDIIANSGNIGGDNYLCLEIANLPIHDHSITDHNHCMGEHKHETCLASHTHSHTLGSHYHTGTGISHSHLHYHCHCIKTSSLSGYNTYGVSTCTCKQTTVTTSTYPLALCTGSGQWWANTWSWVTAAAHSHTLSGTSCCAWCGGVNCEYTAAASGQTCNTGSTLNCTSTDLARSGCTSTTNTINLGNTTLTSGSTGNAGSDTAKDQRPSYYSVIYIKRMG